MLLEYRAKDFRMYLKRPFCGNLEGSLIPIHKSACITPTTAAEATNPMWRVGMPEMQFDRHHRRGIAHLAAGHEASHRLTSGVMMSAIARASFKEMHQRRILVPSIGLAGGQVVKVNAYGVGPFSSMLRSRSADSATVGLCRDGTHHSASEAR